MELDGDGDEADDEEMRMSLLLDLYLYTGACSIDVAVGDGRLVACAWMHYVCALSQQIRPNPCIP
jgi:hypothetical protein